jgi:hypothetical protein
MTGNGAMRRRLVCLVAVIAVPVAGCGRSGTPTAHTSPNVQAPRSVQATASPSPSRTGPLTTGAGVLPGEKPPTEPDLAKRHTAIGAQAFVGYYIDALSWSFATSDPFLIQEVSAPTCKACARYRDNLLELQRDGGHVEGGRFKPVKIDPVYAKSAIRSDYAFEITIEQKPVTVIRPSAAPSVVSKSPITDVSRFYISWQGLSWMIVEETNG